MRRNENSSCRRPRPYCSGAVPICRRCARILVVFGPKKLPELGKGIGEGIRGFKSAMKDQAEEKPASSSTVTANDESLMKG